MSEFQPSPPRLTIKLVYYGPALGGKTTNLLALHDRLAPDLKGELLTLETHNDRTLFFDLLPLGFRAESGLLVKFKLYTVPGQVQHDSTRKAVLSRADGVVFVADSRERQSTNNAESFRNLADNAGRVGLDFAQLPLVVQFNKRDLPDIVAETELRERWQDAGLPLHFASALQGDGVVDTFRSLLVQCYRVLDAEFRLAEDHALDETTFIGASLGTGVAESR